MSNMNAVSSVIPSTGRIECFRHYPQPVLLLSKGLQLIEKNEQADQAIDKHWVGINANNKLHFNSRDSDSYVQKIITELSRRKDENVSERFILRCVDQIYRAYTLALESKQSGNFLLIIQADLTCTERKVSSLTRAFSLTSSETKIVKMMVAGLKPKEIAYEAGISLNTVRSHLRTLYAKMQVRSYNDALTQAIRLLV